jgi:hypothetical protein
VRCWCSPRFGRHVASEIAKWKKIAGSKKIEIQ